MGLSNIQKRLKIKRRVRRNIHGTAERPRLSVFRSNKEIYAQLVDDNAGQTLVAASSREKGAQSGTKTDMAKAVGEAIATKAKDKGIETVVFDRNGFLYHGRIKALAEGARSGGLKF